MSRVESGGTNITLWNLHKIAKALDVTLVDLLLADKIKDQ
jgi:DNA-binding Xre family transcriptional regulator